MLPLLIKETIKSKIQSIFIEKKKKKNWSANKIQEMIWSYKFPQPSLKPIPYRLIWYYVFEEHLQPLKLQKKVILALLPLLSLSHTNPEFFFFNQKIRFQIIPINSKALKLPKTTSIPQFT